MITDESFFRGAGRILYAGMTQAFPTTIGSVINVSTYDAQAGWVDLGATKGGIQFGFNQSEEQFDVDQILTAILTLPTDWQLNLTTNLAENTLDRLAVAWEGSPVTSATEDGVTTKTLGIGAPTKYTLRRLAVLYKRNSGYIRGYFFRQVQRSATQSNFTLNKTGDQITYPVDFKAIADTSITDLYSRLMVIKDQVPPAGPPS